MQLIWWSLTCSLECIAPKAGNKRALAKSAEYPYDFGVAIAGLMPARGQRSESDEVDLKAYEGQDHLGALDDLIKGRHVAWWRKRFTI